MRGGGAVVSCGKVLVVEDDFQIMELVRACLKEGNFEVHCVETGQAALECLNRDSPDVLILDVNLPDIDGLSVCREVRRTHGLPILMLSAQKEDVDKVIGLEVGADDYLGKPFSPRELLARVRALHRRRSGFEQRKESKQILTRGDVVVDQSAHTVTVKDTQLHLTPTEFSLLVALVDRPGQVMTRQMLLDRVWGEEYFGDERIVDVHIRHLRKKLKKHSQTEYVVSVRGVGYRWETE